MKCLPIYLRSNLPKAFVIGGGKIAAYKLITIRSIFIRIALITKTTCNILNSFLNSKLYLTPNKTKIKYSNIAWLTKRPEKLRLINSYLIIIAKNDLILYKITNKHIIKRPTLINIVDNKKASSFIFPSVINKKPIIISICTYNKSPTIAKHIRNKLKATIPLIAKLIINSISIWRNKLTIKKDSNKKDFWVYIFKSILNMFKINQKLSLIKNINPKSNQLKTINTIKIAIIGAGPGNKELITIKGFKLIKEANIILYDNLVSKDIINLINNSSRKIYIGKKAGKKYIKQKAINKLIINLAKKGNNIVRLKGGDPFIFGRGGEEIKEIFNNNISLQIIPGITTAIGSATTAGIPLTHRSYSNSISFTTGKLSYKDKSKWNLELNRKQTIIMYMYAGNIAKLKEKLIKDRFSTKTPIAIVGSCTNKNQKIIISNIKNIESLTKYNITPSILIIGKVIKLYRDLTTFS